MSGDDPLHDKHEVSSADLDMRDKYPGKVLEVKVDDLPLGKASFSPFIFRQTQPECERARLLRRHNLPKEETVQLKSWSTEDIKQFVKDLRESPGASVSTNLVLAASLIIDAIGGDLESTHFRDTPRRFSEMFMLDFSPNGSIEEALEEMYVEETYDEMLIVRDIPIRSMCPHHLLPWFGRATVGYVPNERTVGLSKITRAIDAAGRGPKLQEAVTENITKAIEEVLKPQGSMAVVEAVHMCTLMRGVKTEQQQFTTSSCTGIFRSKPEARQEFLTLLRGQSLKW